MRMFQCLAAALACALVASAAVGQDKAGGEAGKDLDAFKDYLTQNYPKKKWQAGPKRIDSPDIAKAYAGRRFYYVTSSPPLPPGAPLKDLIEAYQKRMQEYQRDYMSLTVALDADGKIAAYAKPADFNQGLVAVKTEDDARTAGAAILSVAALGGVAPHAVAAKDVTVRPHEKGWQVQVQVRNNFAGTVTFNEKGQVTAASKVSTRPLPP